VTLRKILIAPIWCVPIFAFVASWGLLVHKILESTCFIFLPSVAFLDYYAYPFRWFIILPWYGAATYLAMIGTVRLMEFAVSVGEMTETGFKEQAQ
jgi:hypothetical protein